MEIVGIEFDGYFLPYEDDGTSTAHYRSFMIYCINNYFPQILMIPQLYRWFSLAPNDPVFGAGVRYNKVEGYNGIYFSTYNGTEQKIRNMYKIAGILHLDLFVHYIEE